MDNASTAKAGSRTPLGPASALAAVGDVTFGNRVNSGFHLPCGGHRVMSAPRKLPLPRSRFWVPACVGSWGRFVLVVAFALAGMGHARADESRVVGHPVPWEFASARYEVTVNGKPVPVFFATMNLHFVSFDFTGAVEVKVRINEDDYTRKVGIALPKADEFWQGGAVVRPLSRGVKPTTKGRDVAFTLTKPRQYAVERPGTRANTDEVLFLFANPPAEDRPRKDDPKVVWLEPGTH